MSRDSSPYIRLRCFKYLIWKLGVAFSVCCSRLAEGRGFASRLCVPRICKLRGVTFETLRRSPPLHRARAQDCLLFSLCKWDGPSRAALFNPRTHRGRSSGALSKAMAPEKVEGLPTAGLQCLARCSLVAEETTGRPAWRVGPYLLIQQDRRRFRRCRRNSCLFRCLPNARCTDRRCCVAIPYWSLFAGTRPSPNRAVRRLSACGFASKW